MKVTCPSCQSNLNIDDKKIPPKGARIRCPACKNVFPVRPANSAPPIPKFGSETPAPGGWDSEPTRVVPVSEALKAGGELAFLAGAGSSASIPLPPPATAMETSIPLPSGTNSPAAQPSDRDTDFGGLLGSPSSEFQLPQPSAAIPLPSAVGDLSDRQPEAAPMVDAPQVPLPGGDNAPFNAPVELPGRDAPAETAEAAALPMSFELPANEAAIELPSPAQAEGGWNAVQNAESFAFGDSLSDFSAPLAPLSAQQAPADAMPAHTQDDGPRFDFGPPPEAPEIPSLPAFEFGGFADSDLAAEKESLSPSEESPKIDPAFDFGSLPAAPLAPDFHAMDLGPPPPNPHAHDMASLFETGESPPNSMNASDLSPPLPELPSFGFDSAPMPSFETPSAVAENLPPLSFGEVSLEPQSDRPGKPDLMSMIEEGARPTEAEATVTTSRHLHIKRRSGKVFGPFEEAVIIQLLKDGQLLGNEEVSSDTEKWQAIDQIPAFQSAIAAMKRPTTASSPSQSGVAADAKSAAAPSMDKMRQSYEGRMAAVAVVRGREPIPLKKLWPFLVGGVAAMLIVGGGAAIGEFTPYGFFGHKLLFSAKVKPGSPEATKLNEAKSNLEIGTWTSLKAAKTAAEALLKANEFPEARSLWCQIIFALHRNFGVGSPAELQAAQDGLKGIVSLGEKHPDVQKAMAAGALDRRELDAALAHLSIVLTRDEADTEALFLRAEAARMKKQPAQAKRDYEQILKKHPAAVRAHYGLGVLHKAQNEVDDARKHFNEVLTLDADHPAATIEVAELALFTDRNVAAADDLLRNITSAEKEKNMSPSDAAKANALKAEVMVAQGNLVDAVPLLEGALQADPSNAFAQGRLGRLHLRLNDPDKAIGLFEKASTSVPESLDYAEGLLSSLVAVGRMDDAQKVVDRVAPRFPGNAELLLLSARVADAKDNSKLAEEGYKRAIAANDTLAEAYIRLARLYFRFRRFDEALPQLQVGLEKVPNDASLHVAMGEFALEQRNFDLAAKELAEAIRLQPTSAEANLGQSRVLLARDDVASAAEYANKAVTLNPRIPGGRLQRGLVLWKAKRYDEALVELEEAKKLEPGNRQVQVAIGAVSFEKGDFNTALASLNSVLVAEAAHPEANFYLGRLKNAKSEHTQAIDAMKKALESNPKNPVFRYWMGRVLRDARKSAEAVVEWKTAIEIDPNYSDALEALGQLSLDQGAYKPAVNYFKRALAASPDRASAHIALGDASMQLEDWDTAITSYQQAIGVDPQSKSTFYKLARAYEERKQGAKAVEWYRKAIAHEPNNAEAWLSLGWLYKDARQNADAIASFKRYLEIRPDAENKKEIEDEIDFLR